MVIGNKSRDEENFEMQSCTTPSLIWVSPQFSFVFQVMCAPLFYIQRLCAAMRLKFDVTVTRSLSRLFLSYPIDMTVHIGQTITTNVTLSGHASTWLHERGFFTKGDICFQYTPSILIQNPHLFPRCFIKCLGLKILYIILDRKLIESGKNFSTATSLH